MQAAPGDALVVLSASSAKAKARAPYREAIAANTPHRAVLMFGDIHKCNYSAEIFHARADLSYSMTSRSSPAQEPLSDRSDYTSKLHIRSRASGIEPPVAHRRHLLPVLWLRNLRTYNNDLENAPRLSQAQLLLLLGTGQRKIIARC